MERAVYCFNSLRKLFLVVFREKKGNQQVYKRTVASQLIDDTPKTFTKKLLRNHFNKLLDEDGY